ncbi:sigma-70 family RNA polymerase sigma factor [Priestia aryabhattai]|uniref:sigma-70 family RNA polymerase sigma factor n=1 Tax=Priestia aryabhattai TaxID=412384 RepID=UPI002E22EC4D|nr:sigma-70 family RNA polymerase sigma factor [Priestia aryabhattai]
MYNINIQEVEETRFKKAFERLEKRQDNYMDNRVLKLFFKNKRNKLIYEKAKEDPSPKNLNVLDNAFKQHYFTLSFVNYVSKTLHFSAVTYDQKRRRKEEKTPLTVDAPIDEGDTFGDITEDPQVGDISEDIIEKSDSFNELMGDYQLKAAIDKLTENQKVILKKSYIYDMNDTEIARSLQKSQQAVSKTRNKAIEKLRIYMNV